MGADADDVVRCSLGSGALTCGALGACAQRESAQCPDEDEKEFQNVGKYKCVASAHARTLSPSGRPWQGLRFGFALASLWLRFGFGFVLASFWLLFGFAGPSRDAIRAQVLQHK